MMSIELIRFLINYYANIDIKLFQKINSVSIDYDGNLSVFGAKITR